MSDTEQDLPEHPQPPSISMECVQILCRAIERHRDSKWEGRTVVEASDAHLYAVAVWFRSQEQEFEVEAGRLRGLMQEASEALVDVAEVDMPSEVQNALDHAVEALLEALTVAKP